MALDQSNLPLQVTLPFSDTCVATSFTGEEALSTPFLFTLELICENASLDFTQVLGQGVTVSLELEEGGPQYFHGICTRFMQGITDEGVTRYTAELRPWLWMLTLASDCKVFQNQSVPQIVTTIFQALGFTTSDYKSSLSGSYTALEYCVQYRESTFDFVSRLLEGAGISYFFQHASGSHTLVLADASTTYAALTWPTSVTYAGSDYGDDMEDEVVNCLLSGVVTTGTVQVDDFNFTTPATNLTASATATAPSYAVASTMEQYDYPGGYQVQGDGETLAGLLAASQEASAAMLRGDGGVRTFRSGYTFTLAGHDRTDANQSWLLTAVSHVADQEGYSNHFEAVPGSTTWRPPLLTAAPVIAGTQTATVVGNSGSEVYTDQYGRVKVQFHWDQVGQNDENSSCWIRVAQAWAGQGWGTIFIPRVGMEVVVSFLEGDPNQPLVTGCVYNATQTVPYALPDNQTRSTLRTSSSTGGNGNNEIRFEDKAGSEELFIQAQKDMNLTVLNNCAWTITQANQVTVQQGDETLEVTQGNRARTVGQGNDTVTVSQGNRSVTVSQGAESLTVSQGNRTVTVSQGNEDHTVGGKRTLSVTGDESHSNSGAFSQTVGNGYTLNVTGDVTISASGTLTLKSGSSSVTISSTSVSVQGAQSASVNGNQSASIQGGTSLSISSGGTASVSATGSLSVSGAMVSVN
jgi:type VI secretion system secreted protein VgrG